MFKQASAKLKNPKMKFGQFQMYLSQRGNYPGAIYITPLDRDSGWYGRIETDGSLTLNKGKTSPPGLEQELHQLIENPVEYIANYGKLTDNCCFCSRTLADERSLDVGYGPDCAKHYGLPYPTFEEMKKVDHNDITLEQDKSSKFESCYPHWLKHFFYTEKVKGIADRTKCHWLIDAIALQQTSDSVLKSPMHKGIQFWKFTKKGDASGLLTGTWDTEQVVIAQELEFTSFPLESVEMWIDNGLLFLPEEEDSCRLIE